MNKKTRISIIVASLFLVLAIPIIAETAFANSNDLPVQSRAGIISVMGTTHIQGEVVLVEVLVEIQPGENANQVARDVLKAHNLKPFSSAALGTDGFTVTGFFWPTHGLTQLYNPANQPNGIDGLTSLTNTHSDWNGVAASNFVFTYGGISDNCPSMVKECPGRQAFDGENTVGWLKINSRGTLAIAYFATSSVTGTMETDIALNTKYSWNDKCFDDTMPDKIDVETVLRHENGHAAGIGHSQEPTALMAAFYSGPNCQLDHTDDKEAITYLYDARESGTVSGTVTDDVTGNAIEGATVKLEGTTHSASTGTNGVYTISGIPDPVTYTVTASKSGFDIFSIDRLTVDGGEHFTDVQIANFPLSDGGSEPDPTTSCADPGNDNLRIDVIMDVEQKGPWNHLLIPVHVSDEGAGVSNVCVELDLTRQDRSWTFLGTTDSSGDIVFKLSKARDSTFYTASVVNQSHFLLDSDFTERCQIIDGKIKPNDCTSP